MDTSGFFEGLRAIEGNERRPELQELLRRFLAHDYADADGRAAYFASNATFEDPVGITPLVGREAIRQQFQSTVSAGIRSALKPLNIISAGSEAMVVGEARVTVGGAPFLEVTLVTYIRVDADLKFVEFRAFFDEDSAKPGS
jgi:ketosteroid isomerase-like protein